MKAWELLSRPNTWIKFSPARNKEGYSCEPENPEACQFCALGAIRHIYSGKECKEKRISLEEYLIESVCNPYIGFWNDDENRTKEEVVKVLKILDI